MLDFGRYRQILRVALGLTVCFCLMNLLLRAAYGRFAIWTEEVDAGTTQWETGTGSRIAGILRAVEANRATPINLVLGQSTSMTDVDCSLLEEGSAEPSKWYGVAGRTQSFVKMEHTMRLLLRSGLKPKLCVIVVGCAELVGEPLLRNLPGEQREYDPILLQKDTGPGWVFANRGYIKSLFESTLDTARDSVAATLQLPLDVEYEAENGPLGDVIHFDLKEAPEKVHRLRKVLNYFGHYNAASYHVDGIQPKALLRTIDECRQMGARVTVVVQPESPYALSMEPPQGEAALEAVLKEATTQGPVDILNFRTTQPDLQYFFDDDHLNHAGKILNTRRLIQELRSRFGPDYGTK